MTLQEYRDEVKLRLNRMNIVLDTNDILINLYINNNRDSAQRGLLAYNKERFGRIIKIPGSDLAIDNNVAINTYKHNIRSYFALLPDNLISADIVLLTYKDNDYAIVRECRPMDKQETYEAYRSKWALPVLDKPLYTIENIISGNTTNGKKIIISGINDLVSGNDFDLSKVTLKIWYIAALDRLNLETDKEEFLSPEMQERVIYGTMLDCVRAMKDAEKYQSEIMSITNITKSISSEYQKSMVNESNILESNEVKQ